MQWKTYWAKIAHISIKMDKYIDIDKWKGIKSGEKW